MKEIKEVWIVEIKSESGDDYGVAAFGFEPDEEYLERYCREEVAPDEFIGGDGPGRWGSHLHVVGPYNVRVNKRG